MTILKKLFASSLLIVSLVMTIKASMAQDGRDSKWNVGTILLDDSTSLKGIVQNDEKFRVVKFKPRASDTDELSFPEKRILSLEYFDSTISKKRSFFTLKIEDEGSIYVGPVLFEVIMVMKEFVVLSRKYGVLPEGKSKNRDDVSKIEYDQVEKIFLSGEDSKAELLMLNVLMDEKKSNKQPLPVKPFFDWNVLQKFTKPHWADVKKHIKDHDLNPKRRPDLMRLLSFYQSIE